MNDSLGRELKVGDVIVYGKRSGDYGELAVYEVLDFKTLTNWRGEFEKMKCRRLVHKKSVPPPDGGTPYISIKVFDDTKKPVWLEHGDCAYTTRMSKKDVQRLVS